MPFVLSLEQVQRIREYARERHKDQDFDHTMEHVELTVEISRWLARREGADEEISVISAYLHDIAKGVGAEHAAIGAREAGAFLESIRAPEAFIEQVCYAISQHANDLPKLTREAEVLWDADKLQSVGPLGFARVFGYRMVYDGKQVQGAMRKARNYIGFFYDRFYTETGRVIAAELRNAMDDFFRLYDVVVSAELDEFLAARI